jgi:hypothetical protein
VSKGRFDQSNQKLIKMHPLDNVIWQALTTRQVEFAESFEGARRFTAEVSPLAGFQRGFAGRL